MACTMLHNVCVGESDAVGGQPRGRRPARGGMFRPCYTLGVVVTRLGGMELFIRVDQGGSGGMFSSPAFWIPPLVEAAGD